MKGLVNARLAPPGARHTSDFRARAVHFALVLAIEHVCINPMSACHTKPFVSPGVLIAPAPPADAVGWQSAPVAVETCDYCGAATLQWRKCKLICESCQQINKSCADL